MRMLQHSPSAKTFSIGILGQRIRIRCPDPALRCILVANFGGMEAADSGGLPELEYLVEFRGPSGACSLRRIGQAAIDADNAGDLLFLLEKEITVELQRRRTDLYFLHSAAIEWREGACLLAAESGGGKSTTTWGLLHHGFRYLGDELCPIDLESMMVFPYPHALCLKRQPPPDYPLPEDSIDLGRTIHVPARALPGTFVTGPRPLRAVLLVNHRPELGSPAVHSVSTAEAAARLYVTALNALAHDNRGLDAAVKVARHVPCFAVTTGELSASCALIRSTLEQIAVDAGAA